MTTAALSRISGVHPLWAVEGGRVTISGDGLLSDERPPEVRVGTIPARVAFASPHAVTVIVPSGLDGGHTPIRLESAPGETAYVEVGAPIATGLHLVDNPVFDPDGNLYVTFSGSRGQQATVAVYRVRPDGTREPFVTDLPNPTSLTFGPDGYLYVSSRFDGNVHRVGRDGSVTIHATDLGVPCGIAFGPDGNLFVGDRSGSILTFVDGRVSQVAAIPPSVAAFHLAFGPDRALYVSAPTLSSRDVIYRVLPSGAVEEFAAGFGRPQGLAFDRAGSLYVVDAIAGDAALFRIRLDRPHEKERILSGGALIGLAFDGEGRMVVASNDTVYRFAATAKPPAA
ncbi:MAG TPA: IPT/TIG domain-containing protein [Vicinamibacterales bacterium]|jgi:sugar lactone lactonase YvrE|nr:IPT/TIG domain-containing protein [Vicinamibacterales bacterium]